MLAAETIFAALVAKDFSGAAAGAVRRACQSQLDHA